MKKITKARINRLLKKLDEIGDEMFDMGIIAMSGHSVDNLWLINRDTGECYGSPENEGCWMGGDPIYDILNGVTYCHDVSPQANENFKAIRDALKKDQPQQNGGGV